MATFDRFIDPKTKERLFYHPKRQILSTEDRKISYPIIKGIPRFVSPEFYRQSIPSCKDEVQAGRSFGKKWSHPRNRSLGSKEFDRSSLEEQFLAMLGCTSMEDLECLFKDAQRSLNAGCGVAWSEYLFDLNPRTERHCVDISLSVEVAHENTKSMPNVTVSQASIFELPYPDEIFDIVYSCGVLHHAPDPKGALLEIGKKVAPGGDSVSIFTTLSLLSGSCVIQKYAN